MSVDRLGPSQRSAHGRPTDAAWSLPENASCQCASGALAEAIGAMMPRRVEWSLHPVDLNSPQVQVPDSEYTRTLAPRRLAEFAAGRAAARGPLARLGCYSTAVRRGAKGEPLWPRGIVGSISHSRSFGLAAVARWRHFAALGVDLENDFPLGDPVHALVCAQDELEESLRGSPYGAGTTAKILFSVKESLFKAYFPTTRFVLDFLDARVSLDWAGQRCRAELVSTSTPGLHGKRAFEGSFAVAGDHVVSAVTVSRADLSARPAGGAI